MSKKKIGIITLNGYFNYGNRLQNYALQETLKKYNYEVDTIRTKGKKIKNDKESSKIQILLKNPKNLINKIFNLFYVKPLNKKRIKQFKEFSQQYISETNTIISEDNLPKDLLKEYDFFVTGSDQVWNPYFNDFTPLYFLVFAPKHKRIAYSPSFGITEIPDEYKNDYREWLIDMEHISVREDAGADIIKKLSGREAEVLADPTILLSKESWLSIAKPLSHKPKESYLLTYFLGIIPKKPKMLMKIYAKKYKLKIVNLAQPRHKDFYLTDPAEFLDLINSATLFFTDSFHGTVFSILFETPFVVTDRQAKIPSMNSRIQTLLIKYNFKERHISEINSKNILSVDFTHVADILEAERKKADKYLKQALNKKL